MITSDVLSVKVRNVCMLCKISEVEHPYMLCKSCHESPESVTERQHRAFHNQRVEEGTALSHEQLKDTVAIRDQEIAKLKDMVRGLSDRVAAQSDLLTDKAEKKYDADGAAVGVMDREQMLDRCKEVVTKQRASQYGTPEDSFGDIAKMWETYLGVPIGPHNVAVMMILLKVVRMKSSPKKPDSWLDVAGYAACGCEIVTKPKE
jgi:hypothetical protein